MLGPVLIEPVSVEVLAGLSEGVLSAGISGVVLSAGGTGVESSTGGAGVGSVLAGVSEVLFAGSEVSLEASDIPEVLLDVSFDKESDGVLSVGAFSGVVSDAFAEEFDVVSLIGVSAVLFVSLEEEVLLSCGVSDELLEVLPVALL
jgi:hypothetical protein